MKKKGKKPTIRSTSAPVPSKKLTFVFHNSASDVDSVGHVIDSVKKLKREYADVASFRYIQEKGEDAGTAPFSEAGIQVMERTTSLLPVFSDVGDFVIFIEITGLDRDINFNTFFHNEFNFPSPGSAGRMYFKNQLPDTLPCLVIPGDVADYFTTLQTIRKDHLRNELEWYIRHLQLRSENLFTEIENPYGSATPKKSKPFALYAAFRRWYDWTFPTAIHEYKLKLRPGFMKEAPIWRPLFIIASAILLFVLPVISYRAGISGDEEKHWLQAENVYNYFASGGQDTLALSDTKYKLNYYGQSFDLLTYVVIKTFHIEKIYETRHVMNGIAGALAILCTALLVRLLLGNAAGLLSIFLMFFSPRFLGHAMNNPLDIPFALGYIFTLLQMVRFLKRLPVFSVRTIILLMFGIAFTISIRIGGLILIPYLFMFSFLYVLFNHWPWPFMSAGYRKFIQTGVFYLVIISAGAFFLSLIPWPYGQRAPLRNPFTSLAMMSNITVALRVMFEGKIIWSDNLPWYYVPKNILITVPVVILVFYLIPLFTFYRQRRNVHPFWIFMLYFASVFPVAYIIYKESNVYGGWRHVMFIYPAMITLCTAGIIWTRDLFARTMDPEGIHVPCNCIHVRTCYSHR